MVLLPLVQGFFRVCIQLLLNLILEFRDLGMKSFLGASLHTGEGVLCTRQ